MHERRIKADAHDAVCMYVCIVSCDHLFQTVLAFSTFQSLVEKPITFEIGPDYNANSKRDTYFYCPLEFNGLAGFCLFGDRSHALHTQKSI